MPDFYVDEITIEPYEFIRECSKHEIRELVEVLVDEGYLPPSTLSSIRCGEKGVGVRSTVLEDEFHEKMDMLSQKYRMINKDDEDILNNLFKKYL